MAEFLSGMPDAAQDIFQWLSGILLLLRTEGLAAQFGFGSLEKQAGASLFSNVPVRHPDGADTARSIPDRRLRPAGFANHVTWYSLRSTYIRLRANDPDTDRTGQLKRPSARRAKTARTACVVCQRAKDRKPARPIPVNFQPDACCIRKTPESPSARAPGSERAHRACPHRYTRSQGSSCAG